MALLEILHFPDPRLHLKAHLVKSFDKELKKLVDDMAQTMYQNDGIGLAATQVNIQKRLIIIDVSKSNDQLLVFVNPEVVSRSGEVIGEEGCLSVPGVYDSVTRSENISVKFQDLEGNIYTKDYTGLMSVCVQHEIDHLDGKVFVEYLSSLKQNFIKKKMKKIFKSQ
jgi:peptide deformylase